MLPATRIQWLTDLVGLEIELWNRIDARLRAAHDLSLASFEALFFIAQTPSGSLRVGDLARALRVTISGTSKVVDRIERAGLIQRKSDLDDRRACPLVLTSAGKRKLAAASKTYEAEMTTVLDATLSANEQHHLHALVLRLLAATSEPEK